MIQDILAFKAINLLALSVIIYFASFAIPTGALFLILSFGSISVSISERIILVMIVYFSTILGDISTYFFARLFSKYVNKTFCINPWLKRNEHKAHIFIEKHGFYAIFLSRFLFSGLGAFINYYCGIKKYSKKKFISAILLGELFYSVIYSSLGMIFKDFIGEILNIINGIFILLVLGIMIYFTAKKLIKEINRV